MSLLQREQSHKEAANDSRFFCYTHKYQQPIIIEKHQNIFSVHCDGKTVQQWSFSKGQPVAILQLEGSFNSTIEQQYTATLAMLENVFSNCQQLTTLILHNTAVEIRQKLQKTGIVLSTSTSLDNDNMVISADLFWQQPALWLNSDRDTHYPLHYIISNEKRHPQRPPQVNELVYSRYIPWLKKSLTFYTVDIERDLNTINQWMNKPSVAEFYDEEGDLNYHKNYLQKQLNDPHTLPLIGYFDNQPFGYFEVYWTKEDRISPFYQADDFDRGWHMLVGDENFRGKSWFIAWCSSIIHFMFLDDCRTQRIICEPRHDHPKLIKNLDRFGFSKIKEFDFPHKRSMLLILLRDQFFEKKMMTNYINANF